MASGSRNTTVAAARKALGWLAPHGLMEPRRRRQIARADADLEMRLVDERRRLLDGLAAQQEDGDTPAFGYETAIAALVEEGLDEQMVRDGSVPQASLDFASERLRRFLSDEPLALHVGNFVGVSLAHLTSTLVRHAESALVISVDPGMPHRGISYPDRVTLRLLERFGLSANSLVLTGFSVRKNVRDDGTVCGPHATVALDHDAAKAALGVDAACEEVLRNLARLLPARLDVVMLDGNHDADYLRRELESVDRLLRPGGLLILDDVQPGVWQGVVDVFEDLTSERGRYVRVDYDGRIGLLARQESPAATAS